MAYILFEQISLVYMCVFIPDLLASSVKVDEGKCFVCVLKCWLKRIRSHYCVPQNKDPFKIRANMFLSIELFPWRLGSSIIVFGTQTETDQTRRQPTDQNGSCGSGTLHALIRFGLGWFWCVHTKTSTPVCLWPCQVVCQKRPKISNTLEKADGCYSPPPLGATGASRQSPSSCGFSELRRHFLCGFFNSSTCHLAGSAIVPFPFSPCSFCWDELCHPLMISTFVAFVFGPTSEVHLVFYVSAFHA